MRAIDKMVEWLEKRMAENRFRREDYILRECLKEARRLAALAKEREGEVVLGDGLYDEMKDDVAIFYGYRLEGKRGQLIFRPAKGVK